MASGQEQLARLIERDGVAAPIVAAFRAVDRADFVPEEGKFDAYADRPVVIPEHQTTSQPSLIARMIEAAEVGPDDRVLEVGTGFGFQTALLAHLAREVVSIDRHSLLIDRARANLATVGITNVELVVGDGWKGWRARAPYAAIIVSAGAAEVPRAYRDQLIEGGRAVIPISSALGDDVYLFRLREGELAQERLLTPARFVPLIPGEARPDE